METILKNEERIIKNIIHIADIHISKNNERHEEYLQVINNLLLKLSKEEQDSVVVICGDTIDNKSIMMPEQIVLTKYLFYNISVMFPIIIILGNHDMNRNDTKRTNGISAILNKMERSNEIYLLEDHGLYVYNNIVFGLTGMEMNNVVECKKIHGKIRVGLYHGIINGAKTDDNNQLTSDKSIGIKDFQNNYDITCLGDVHKHQYLNKRKTIAYSGSLIQQNIGESVEEHGYIRWNLSDLTSEFIKINNNNKMIKIFIDENGYQDEIIENENTNIKFYIYYKNISNVDAMTFGIKLKKKYPNSKYLLYCCETNKFNNIKVGINNKIYLNDLKTNIQVEKLLLEYIEKNDRYIKIDNKKRESIKNLIKKYVEESEINYNNNEIKTFELVELKFDNFFIFDKDNVINFAKFSGIVGINGKVHTGKSTIVDCLLYSIYGKCSRGDVIDTININEKQMKTKIIFKVNQDIYEITRKRELKNSKKESKRVTSIEKIVLQKNGTIITFDNLAQTNKEIEKILCGYDDFVNTIVMLQQSELNIINVSSRARKDIICKLFKLDILNKINDLIEINIKITNKKIKNFQLIENNNYESEINNIKKDTTHVSNKLSSLNDELKKKIHENIEHDIKKREFYENKNKIMMRSKKMGEIKQLEDKIKSETSKRDNIKNKVSAQEQLLKNSNKHLLKNNIEKLKKEYNDTLEKLHTDVKYDEKEMNIIKTQINKYKEQVKKDCDNNRKKEEEINTLTNKISTMSANKIMALKEQQMLLTQNINKKEDLTKIRVNVENDNNLLRDYEFDKKCTYCMKNILTKEKMMNMDKMNNIDQQIKEVDDIIRTITEYLDINKNDIDQIKTFDDTQKTIKEKEKEYNTINTELMITKETLKNLEEKYNIIEKDKNKYIENKKIKNNANTLESSIKENENKLSEIEEFSKNIIELNNEMNKHENKINTMINDLTKEKYEYSKLCDHKEINMNENEEKNKSERLLKEKTELEKHIEIEENNYFKLKEERHRLELERKDYLNNKKIMETDGMLVECLEIIRDTIMGTNEKNENNKGLINSIIDNNILPKLEDGINDILKVLCDYTIRMQRKGVAINIIKERNDKRLNIDTNSGSERLTCDIAFRLALLSMNQIILTNMLILDETFVYLDEDSMGKLEDIIKFMKEKFKYMILISHDERIKQLYDNNIYIKTINGRSHIDQ